MVSGAAAQVAGAAGRCWSRALGCHESGGKTVVSEDSRRRRRTRPRAGKKNRVVVAARRSRSCLSRVELHGEAPRTVALRRPAAPSSPPRWRSGRTRRSSAHGQRRLFWPW